MNITVKHDKSWTWVILCDLHEEEDVGPDDIVELQVGDVWWQGVFRHITDQQVERQILEVLEMLEGGKMIRLIVFQTQFAQGEMDDVGADIE